jgi:hypothetical protein
MGTQGVRGEAHNFLFMLMDPGQTLVERDFIQPVAVGQMNRQPIRSTLAKWLAFGEYEQGSSDIVRLRIHQLRQGIRAATVIQLVRKIDVRFIEQAFRQPEAKRHDSLEGFDAVVDIESVGAFPAPFFDLLGIGVLRQRWRSE